MHAQRGWVALTVAGSIVVASLAWSQWNSPRSQAQAALPQQQDLNFQWEYAVLQFNGNPNSYRFTYGDEILGREGCTLGNLMVLIQGRTQGQPTLANLMNVIGAKGWELFAFNEQPNGSLKFIFKRIL